MTDNKFKSKQELNDYIKNNSTSFEEFEKRLDYSKFDKFVNKTKKQKGFSWKKLGYALASLVLVIAAAIGIHFTVSIWNEPKCPYEFGTYTYYSQEGDIEGLDFNEESYVILTDQELSGPGTFVLKDKDWTVYGQFYECEFEDKAIDITGNYFSTDIYNIYISSNAYLEEKSIYLEIKENYNIVSYVFVYKN